MQVTSWTIDFCHCGTKKNSLLNYSIKKKRCLQPVCSAEVLEASYECASKVNPGVLMKLLTMAVNDVTVRESED